MAEEHFDVVSDAIVSELRAKTQNVAEVLLASARVFEPLVSDIATVSNDFNFLRRRARNMWRKNEFHVQDIAAAAESAAELARYNCTFLQSTSMISALLL